MLTKEMALEIAAQAPAEAVAPAPVGHLSYIISDAPCQPPDPAVAPLEELERQLAEVARERLATARRSLDEAQERIQRERAERQTQLDAAQAALNNLQQQLASLDGQRAQYETRARVFLNAADRENMLAQIHLSFNVRQLQLEEQIEQARQALDAVSADHHASVVAEELELELLRGDIQTLEEAAPDVAAQITATLDAPTHLNNAIQLAREGLVAQAERELALARLGNPDGAALETAETAVADARRRLIARQFLLRIEQIEPESPGTVGQLKRLTDEAHEQGVLRNVEPFLNRTLKLARSAATARYREAMLQADHLADQGLVPVVGDGRIEAWEQKGSGWVLVEVWMFQDGAWVGHQPRVRVTRSETPRRLRRSPWYRRQAPAPNAA